MHGSLVGSSEYFPDLVNRVREKSSSVDAVLLESLLMAVIAGPRHLCIRTNAGSIVETSHTVEKLLSTILGYQAHAIHIEGHLKPTSMLSRCFLQDSSSYLHRGHIHVGKTPSNAYTNNSHIGSQGPASSLGMDYTSDATSHDYAVLDDAMTFASSRRPLLDRPMATDMDRIASVNSKVTSNSPPQCLVVTGLERAGPPAQRALWQVLVDERVELDEHMYKMEEESIGEVGVWPLHKDFLLIYICESDQWERPRIHKGLLDALAFSAEFHPPKHARTWSKSRTDSFGPRSASALSANGQQSTTTVSAPVISPSELSTLRDLCMEPSPFDTIASRRPRVYIQAHLGMYATDLLSMARHAPELDGTLLTRRAHDDLAAFARARRVIRGDNSGAVLIRAALEEVKAVMREATSMTSDPASGTLDEGPFAGGTVRESGDWLHVGAKSMRSGDDESSIHESLSERGEAWEVSDEEIRAAFPVVVRHRVRVKDSLEDGIPGAMYLPMRGQIGKGQSKEVRRSVEDILQDILEDRDVSFVS